MPVGGYLRDPGLGPFGRPPRQLVQWQGFCSRRFFLFPDGFFPKRHCLGAFVWSLLPLASARKPVEAWAMACA